MQFNRPLTLPPALLPKTQLGRNGPNSSEASARELSRVCVHIGEQLEGARALSETQTEQGQHARAGNTHARATRTRQTVQQNDGGIQNDGGTEM